MAGRRHLFLVVNLLFSDSVPTSSTSAALVSQGKLLLVKNYSTVHNASCPVVQLVFLFNPFHVASLFIYLFIYFIIYLFIYLFFSIYSFSRGDSSQDPLPTVHCLCPYLKTSLSLQWIAMMSSCTPVIPTSSKVSPFLLFWVVLWTLLFQYHVQSIRKTASDGC